MNIRDTDFIQVGEWVRFTDEGDRLDGKLAQIIGFVPEDEFYEEDRVHVRILLDSGQFGPVEEGRWDYDNFLPTDPLTQLALGLVNNSGRLDIPR